MKALKFVLLIFLSGLIPSMALSATFEVTIDENGFNPASLTIKRGDTVKWVNTGISLHSVTSGYAGTANGYFDSGLLNQGGFFEYKVVFPGELKYFDKSNSSKSGTLIAEGVTISPGSSVLATWQGFDLILVIKADFLSSMSVVYNGLTILETGIPSGGINVGVTDTQAVAPTFYIPPFTLPRGIHTLSVTIITPSGTILTDEATYTVIDRFGFSVF